MVSVSVVDDAIDAKRSNLLDVCKKLLASWRELSPGDIEVNWWRGKHIERYGLL